MGHLVLNSLATLPVLILNGDLVGLQDRSRSGLAIQDTLLTPIVLLLAVGGARPSSSDDDGVVQAEDLGAFARALASLGKGRILATVGCVVVPSRSLHFTDQDTEDWNAGGDDGNTALSVSPDP